MTTTDTDLHSPEPIAPSSHYGCGDDDCIDCYGNIAWRMKNCPGYFLADLFEYENCEECGLGEDDHTAVPFLGNYFARCDRPEVEA